MKRSKFSEQEIAFILWQAEEGTAVGELCRKAGISEATYYNWRKKYGGLMPSEMKRLKQLEEENQRLKKRIKEIAETRGAMATVALSCCCGGKAGRSTTSGSGGVIMR